MIKFSVNVCYVDAKPTSDFWILIQKNNVNFSSKYNLTGSYLTR